MNKVGILLLGITILLSFLSIFILYETSTYTAQLNLGDKYYFIKNQIIWVSLGIISALVLWRINHKKLYNFSFPLLLLSIILLIGVFIPGIGKNLKGAQRWIDLKISLFQPSELLKITLSLYLAAWLSNIEKHRLMAFLLLFGVCIGLVALEPDMGTAFIIASTALVVFFLSGAKIREMAFIFLLLTVSSYVFIHLQEYRLARFTSFNDFNAKDILSSSYHIKQILLSLGSSGLFGVGIGNSIEKYAYLPELTTDSIFAIYAEETGFFGSIFLLSLLVIQLLLGFFIAIKTKDKFGKLLASGIITFLGIQSLVNLASQTVVIPLTGVPLPFISYGGSSMLINFMSIGILLSVSKNIT